jgi:hypothetical protein
MVNEVRLLSSSSSKPHNMKPLTAQKLFEILNEMKIDGYNLDTITINYRTDPDSDVDVVTYVGEDLYDETNTELKSLVLMADASEYED